MKIKAVVAQAEPTTFKLETVDIEAPRADEILVRIAGVGLCHTDLLFASGEALELPAVLGHEGAGVVQQVGWNVSKVKPGDRVAISFRSCGACDRCYAGDPAYCRTMPMLNYMGMRPDGSKSISNEKGAISSNFFGQSSFASYALTYERNVVKLPHDVPLELMGPLGCGVQTGVGAVTRSLAASQGSSILIIGGGSVGLSAVMGARLRKCGTIILAEPITERRGLGLEFGATHIIDPTETELSDAVLSIAPMGVDYALDTTGIDEMVRAVPPCLGSKAVFGIVGIPSPETPTPGQLINLVTLGHTIKGIIEGDSDPDEFIPELIDHYRAGKLPFDRLITTYALSEINQAIQDQAEGRCVKAVLLP